jgi:vacuolar-type H+-ATPase subunit I/STV1
MTAWSEDDFTTFHQRMHSCRQAAAQQGRSQTATALINADSAIANLRYVDRIQRSRASLDAAIKELEQLPDNAAKKDSIHQAERALRGRFDRGQLSKLPSQMQADIQSITNAKKYLPEEEVDRYSKTLSDMYTAAAAIGSEERISAISDEARAAEQQTLQLEPPTLAKGSSLMATRFEDVYIGMRMDAAIASLEKKGYKVKRHAVTLQRLNMAMQYPIDTASLV